MLHRHRHCLVVTVQNFRSVLGPLHRCSPFPTPIYYAGPHRELGCEQRDARRHMMMGFSTQPDCGQLYPAVMDGRAGRCNNLGPERTETFEHNTSSLPADVTLTDEGNKYESRRGSKATVTMCWLSVDMYSSRSDITNLGSTGRGIW